MVDLTELYHIQVSINQGDAFQPAFSLICFFDTRDERAADIDFNGNLKKTPFYVLLVSFTHLTHNTFDVLTCLQPF